MRSSSALPTACVRFWTFELAQDLLDVILTVSGLIPRMVPISELLLPRWIQRRISFFSRAERVDALRRRAAVLERTPELRAHPREVQERDNQFEEKGLLAAEVAGHAARTNRLTGLPSESWVPCAMTLSARDAAARGKSAARKRHAAACAADDRMEFGLDPFADEIGHERRIAPEHLAHLLRSIHGLAKQST